MTHEAAMVTLMKADAPLMAILTGGVFTDEEVGVEGIRRDEGTITEDSYDEKGVIKPLAVVKEGNVVPYGPRSVDVEILSQTIMIYFIQFRGHDQIDLAKERTKIVLNQKRLGRTYPIWHVFDSMPVPDAGPVMNSTVINQVWQVVFTRVFA